MVDYLSNFRCQQRWLSLTHWLVHLDPSVVWCMYLDILNHLGTTFKSVRETDSQTS